MKILLIFIGLFISLLFIIPKKKYKDEEINEVAKWYNSKTIDDYLPEDIIECLIEHNYL